MRKVWQLQRAGRPGTYVEWYDDLKRRRSKYFSPKYRKFIKPFMTRKFAELNADVRPIGSVIDIDFDTLKTIYLEEKESNHLAAASITEIENTLKIFKKTCQPYSSKQITTAMITRFKTALGKLRKPNREKLSNNTINKHLRNLAALVHFGQERHYIEPGIKITKIKATEKPARILTNPEIRNLLAACQEDTQWRLRILLALCTGLRRSDLDNLTVRDINVELKTVTCRNQKTGKVTNYQPLPDKLMPSLERFILEEVADRQQRLFRYRWSKKWYTITKRAGLDDLEFHDLRKTFSSLQADAGTPIKAVQEMLGHSNIDTTMRHYIRTNDTEKRAGVNRLNVAEWL